VSSLIFSGMSGSAVADAVGMGKIIINMMTKDGKYTASYAAAITAASSVIDDDTQELGSLKCRERCER